MGELRDKDIIRTKPTRISPLFALPKDLDEGSLLALEGDSDDTYGESDLSVADSTDNPDGVLPEDGPQTPPYIPFVPVLDPRPLMAPVDIRVKSQTFKFRADGSYVVDVILEFPDIEGAEEYEGRIAT